MPLPERPVVLVTGASTGIGRAVALRFAADGARLVLCARTAHTLEEVRVLCVRAGAEVEVVPTDVVDAARVDAAVRRATERFGRLDVVVSVAGVTAYGTHTDTPAETFDRVVAVNLLGAANLARSSLPVLAAQGGGTVVVVGSLLDRVAVPTMGAYVASKWGLRGLTRSLQQECRSLPGVRVTAVTPGSVRTGIYTSAASSSGRTGTPPPPSTSPERVARVVHRAAVRPRRGRDVDALGGLGNVGMRAVSVLAPAVFDAAVGPLVRLLGTTGVADDGSRRDGARTVTDERR